MGKNIARALTHDWYFWIFSIISVMLLVASFCIPPYAIIDSSVLAAVGELFGFAGLGTVIKAIDKGIDATFRHKDTEVAFTNDENHTPKTQ